MGNVCEPNYTNITVQKTDQVCKIFFFLILCNTLHSYLDVVHNKPALTLH